MGFFLGNNEDIPPSINVATTTSQNTTTRGCQTGSSNDWCGREDQETKTTNETDQTHSSLDFGRLSGVPVEKATFYIRDDSPYDLLAGVMKCSHTNEPLPVIYQVAADSHPTTPTSNPRTHLDEQGRVCVQLMSTEGQRCGCLALETFLLSRWFRRSISLQSSPP